MMTLLLSLGLDLLLYSDYISNLGSNLKVKVVPVEFRQRLCLLVVALGPVACLMN